MMKKKLLTLLTVAGMTLGAHQASAITTITLENNATTSPIIPGDDSAFFWTVSTIGGPSTVTFTNSTSVALRSEFSWSLLAVPFNSDPTFEFEVMNGGSGQIAFATTVPDVGFRNIVIPVGESLSFSILMTSGNAVASGQVTFAPIPLPAGVLLLLTALGGLAATRKLSRKPELV